MDTGMGELAPVSEDVARALENEVRMQPHLPSVFRVGETVNLKGSRFRIEFIDGHCLIIKIGTRSKVKT